MPETLDFICKACGKSAHKRGIEYEEGKHFVVCECGAKNQVAERQGDEHRPNYWVAICLLK